MSGSDWLKSEKTQGTEHEQSWHALFAFPPETAPDRFLDLAVKALLAASGADRAGVWVTGDFLGSPESGCIAEAIPGPIPEQWKHLDFSHGFPREVFQSAFPLLCGPGLPFAIPHLGQLVGMRKAVWLPICAKRIPLGIALAAYGGAQFPIHLDRLCDCAQQIASALAIFRDRRRLDTAGEEIRSLVRISSDVLANVPARAIFSQLVRAARLYTGAEFIALRMAGLPPPVEIACDCSEEWRTHLELDFSSLWQMVEREGCILELDPTELEAHFTDQLGRAAGSTIERVIAFPLKIGNRTSAVFLAGLRRSEDSSETRSKLAQYTALATLTLDREKRKGEGLEWVEACRYLIEQSPQGLIELDAGGRIRTANRAARKLVHISGVNPPVKFLEDLFDPSAQEAVAEWREKVVKTEPVQSRIILEATLAAGDVARLQFCMDLPYQNDAPHENDADARSLIRLDRPGLEKSPIEAASGLQGILLALAGAIDSGVLLLDSAGNIRMVSDRFAQIMEAGPQRLLELGTMDRLIDHLADQFNRPGETARRWRECSGQSEPAVHDEFEMLRPSAKVIERMTKPLLGADGKIAGRLEVYRDITGQRMVQSKLLQAEKMAALGQFVSGIAHELNNPLTSIHGYAQLLSTRGSAAERLSDAQRIAQEAERAGGIVKNLLLFARETKPERSLVDLNEVVKRTIALRSYELNLENIQIDMDLDPDLPRTLADSAQLQQVILNLVINSEQAIRQGKGGGHLEIATRRLPDARIVLEIADDGPGMPPDVAARIFDPFFTTKPAGVGTGLGLSIVYGIVQEHGGEIGVESHPNQGTTLRIELPAALSTADSREVATHLKPKPEALPFPCPSAASKMERILVIEDEPTVAQLLADILSNEGYDVDVLLDSREGIERLREPGYALAICDLKMPHLDGAAIFRELRRTGSVMQDRLLFVTGDTLSPRTLEFLNSSGMPYLAKPFLVEELKQVVRRAIASFPSECEPGARQDWSREVGRRT